MKSFGEYVANRRKAREMNQEAFAQLLGVSQASVSRLESSPECPPDVRLVAKIAKALDVPLVELLPEELQNVDTPSELFFAFCPNPLCSTNELGMNAVGAPVVAWESGMKYRSTCFEDVNFCESCGESLIKECPSCKRRLTKLAKFCLRCGERTYNRPTDDEWIIIEKKVIVPPPAHTEDDEIPF